MEFKDLGTGSVSSFCSNKEIGRLEFVGPLEINFVSDATVRRPGFKFTWGLNIITTQAPEATVLTTSTAMLPTIPTTVPTTMPTTVPTTISTPIPTTIPTTTPSITTPEPSTQLNCTSDQIITEITTIQASRNSASQQPCHIRVLGPPDKAQCGKTLKTLPLFK